MWLSFLAPRLSCLGNQQQQQVAYVKPVWETPHSRAGETCAVTWLHISDRSSYEDYTNTPLYLNSKAEATLQKVSAITAPSIAARTHWTVQQPGHASSLKSLPQFLPGQGTMVNEQCSMNSPLAIEIVTLKMCLIGTQAKSEMIRVNWCIHWKFVFS